VCSFRCAPNPSPSLHKALFPNSNAEDSADDGGYDEVADDDGYGGGGDDDGYGDNDDGGRMLSALSLAPGALVCFNLLVVALGIALGFLIYLFKM
jgi:hypothetical protein